MGEKWRQELYREIPKVDEFLGREMVRRALAAHPRWAVLETVREVLEGRRALISSLASPPREGESPVEGLEEEFQRRLSGHALPRLKPLVNATGIIVHTNLGRSCLAPEALRQAERVAAGYSNLEYRLDRGERGSRQDHVTELLCRLTGAEAALAVNNNAAAVLLCLGTHAAGREVVVSRGQLVEIGGSFRIPDVMARSGAVLREVGTTNKTHLSDYRDAVGPQTAMILKVHTSNFQVVGFTSSVALAELASLGREHGLPVMDDLGSGCLVDLSAYGLRGEPTVRSAVEAGADLVTFSGDKLLGGPQSGLIVGRRDLVDAIRSNPLHRAVRLDKVTLAALEATLRLYLEGERVLSRIPTLRMISEPVDLVRRRARRLARRLSPETKSALAVSVVTTASQVGGGALPLEEIPSAAVSLGGRRPAHELEEGLRKHSPPVIGRVHEGRLLLDMRTVADGEIETVAAAVESLQPS